MSINIVELYTLDIDGTSIMVGSNLDTRELSFYTKRDGIILPVDEVVHNQVIKMISQLSEGPSTDFKELLENSINNCRNYNSKKGYSNSNLEKNIKYLSISCDKSDLEQSDASYDVLNNTFTFILPKPCLDFTGMLGIRNAITMNQITSHEVGHMSVSDISVDKDNNLVGNIGFLQMKIPIKISKKTSDGNNYFIIDKNHEIKENGARGLEELFNELETDERTNGATAPNFAHRLDRITDRNLHFARRNHSLTDYYISMQNIIPSRDKAMLLLMGIEAYYNCVGQQNKEFASKLEEKISQILDDYEIKKISSRNDVAHQSITSESTELNISDDTDSR